MTTRKTIPVEDVKRMANDMLRDSVDDMTDGRIAVAILLEQVLMATGNYHGFRYLPGVVEIDESIPSVKVTGDESRRQYY